MERRNWRLVVAVVASVVAGALAPLARGAPVRAATDGRPATVPALQRWTPAEGSWTLPARPRVVASPRDARLLAEAEQLAADLRALTRRPVTVAASDRGRAGDVVLKRAAREPTTGDEGYRLRIRDRFEITASTSAGIFYGGRTLLQLLRHGARVPAGDAADWPRYRDRGLMLDLGRIPFSRVFLESQIVRLSSLKMNVLHLHLTDDQRWGIRSDRHPELASPGALTRDDVTQLHAVAATHHVRLVPEIDLPGHAQSLLVHHPRFQLAVAGVVRDPTARSYVFNKLDIGNPDAVALVRDLLDEYMSMFPERYFHLGVDEYISPAQWALYPDLARFAITRYGPGATPSDAIHGFINDMNRLARRHGKQLVVWNDQLGGGTGRAPVDPDVLVEWWSTTSPIGDPVTVHPRDLLERGHDLLNAGVFPTYYAEDVGPLKAKSSMRQAYEEWDLTRFCGPATTGDVNTPCWDVPDAGSRIRGSLINVWGPLDETPPQIAEGIRPRLRVLSQKTWGSPPLTTAYESFERIADAAGAG